jgi:hypothetical protein
LLVQLEYTYRDTGSRLEIVDLETGKRRSLGSQTHSGSWSPDGASIIYVSSKGATKGDCVYLYAFRCALPGDIFISNADGTDRRRLRKTAAIEDDPSWNPAGDRIVYSSNPVMPRSGAATEIYSMKPDGSCRVALTNGAPGSFNPVWGGPGSGTQPVCGQPPPEVLAEVDLRGTGSPRSGYWIGKNAGGTLLSQAFVGGYSAVFSYADCDLTVPSACRRGSFASYSLKICAMSGTLSVLGHRDTVFLARRGAAVFFDGFSSGANGVWMLSGSELTMAWGRDRKAALQLIDRLQPVPGTGKPVRRLPAPRISSRDLRTLKVVEREVRRLGSVDAAAAELGRKRVWVGDVLRFGRRIRSLGPIRTIKCPRDTVETVTFREHSPGPSGR